VEFQAFIAFSSFVVHVVIVANAMVMKKNKKMTRRVFFTLPTFC
jgi:hypothetical protein